MDKGSNKDGKTSKELWGLSSELVCAVYRSLAEDNTKSIKVGHKLNTDFTISTA